MVLSIVAAVFVTAVAFPAMAQSWREANRAALDAYESEDWPAYLQSVTRLDELRPNHPRVLFNLAGALAHNGRNDDALSTLERLASMGVVMPVKDDDDLAALRDTPRFVAVVERLAKNAAPFGSAKRAATIDAKGALPEGVAYHSKSGTLFVSTVIGRSVWSVDRKGRASKLPIAGDQLWSAMGMYSSSTSRFPLAGSPIMVTSTSPPIVLTVAPAGALATVTSPPIVEISTGFDTAPPSERVTFSYLTSPPLLPQEPRLQSSVSSLLFSSNHCLLRFPGRRASAGITSNSRCGASSRSRCE